MSFPIKSANWKNELTKLLRNITSEATDSKRPIITKQQLMTTDQDDLLNTNNGARPQINCAENDEYANFAI